ncbi:MAG: tetratricopeptide repeat protein [Phycisphaerales bacterium]|nr:tetratricopeptide repeat protein [Phycisphaerales bacterium]
MDRERLKDVQKSELTDDRLNEDFVVWLKTKGPSWLLAILVAIVAYLFIVNWQQKELRAQNEAWISLQEAQLPASLEDVAIQYPDVDSVANQARVRAANIYMQSVYLGRPIGAAADSTDDLSEEDRLFNLERADALYAQVLAGMNETSGDTLMAATALNGQAAVAESRGQLDAARNLYEQAAARAESMYPFIAARSRSRASTIDLYDELVELPEAPEAAPDLPVIPNLDTPTTLEDLANPLNLPKLPATPEPSNEDSDAGSDESESTP